MSACIIRVKFLPSSRICSAEPVLETMKYTQPNRHTSIVLRANQTLFLTSERDELDVRVESDTEAFDRTRDSQKACRPRAIVVTAWSSRTAKRASTVIVRANEDRLGGIPCRPIATTVYRRVISRDGLRE